MSIFTSSNTNSVLMFPKHKKFIKSFSNSFVGVNGSSVETSISLSDILIPYDNYNRIKTILPKNNNNFVLSYPLVGLKPTFLIIKPDYCGCDNTKKFLHWKWLHSNEPFNVMTDILVLTGTATNPIPQIVLSNPNVDKSVTLEILVVSTEYDIFTDSTQFLYIQNAEYDHIRTINATSVGIFNDLNEMITSVDISDINNIFKPQVNRVIIDETTDHDIIIDFINDQDANQTFSSLSYLFNNPTAILPMPRDTVSPVITYTPIVTATSTPDVYSSQLTLSNFTASLITKQLISTNCIANVFDNRDGNIILMPVHFSITLNDVEYGAITQIGTYKVKITVKDLAGNKTIETIILDVN